MKQLTFLVQIKACNYYMMQFYNLHHKITLRSSHRRCSVKKGVLRNFAKFTGKHLCQRLCFNRPATLLKKSLCHRCFPVNFAKLLRIPFLQNTSGRLLLYSLYRNYLRNLMTLKKEKIQ